MDLSEAVLPCPICGHPTIHRPAAVDGQMICQQCLARMRAAAPDKQTRRTVPLRLGLLIAGLVVVIGFVHIVHGGSAGMTVCAKDGWALEDTFVDLDDYIGKPLLANIDKAKVLRAMFACGTLERPEWLDKRR